MIICTKSADVIARQAFGKGNIVISSLDNMMKQFPIDPTIGQTTKEAFIVTGKDFRNKAVKDKFIEACATKHPDVRVIFYSFKSTPEIQQGNGVDLVFGKTAPSVIRERVYELVQDITNKAEIVSSSEIAPEKVAPATFGSEWDEPAEVEETPVVPTDESAIEEAPEEIVIPEPEPEPSPVPAPVNDASEIIDRIRGCERTSDVVTLTNELNAAKVINEVLSNNQQYIAIEEKLKGLQEKIYSVWSDPFTKSTSEKLDKIKALCYDKMNYSSGKNTVIAQRTMDIITSVLDQTIATLNKRSKELDELIVKAATTPAGSIGYSRISALLDERANLLLELAVTDEEVQKIACNVTTLAQDVSGELCAEAANTTGSPILDAKLRLSGRSIVPDNTVEKCIHIMSTADRTSEEFQTARRDLLVLKAKLNKVLEVDRDTILALQQAITYLGANNVEDTVVAKTLSKQALRLYIAKSDSGRTVVPYVISKLESRRGLNVLYMDLTGESKLSMYGENSVTYEDWYEKRYEKDFCAVVGSIADTPDAIQRLEAALVKAADFYPVINLVVSPEQIELIKTIAPGVLVMNYVTNPYAESIDFYKGFIRETAYENVAQRLIVNRCNVSLKPIIDRLELLDTDVIDVKTIPFIPELIECSLCAVKPYELESVVDGFREVAKNVKS